MGDGSFVEAATPFGLDSLSDGRGIAASDFDGDGDLDFIINNYNRPAHYFVNELPRRHWLRVRLRGRESNRDGIGATIRVRTGDRLQTRVVTAGDGYASQFSRVAHFGLGDSEVVDVLEVTWPGGEGSRGRGSRERVQRFHHIGVDRLIEIDEDRKDSLVVRRRSQN